MADAFAGDTEFFADFFQGALAAVFNGVAAVPLLFLVAKMARNEKIMGEYKSGWLSNFVLWFTFLAMAAAAIAMFWTIRQG